MTKTSQIRIGTSGWQYSHWQGPFYPEELAKRSFLEYFAQQFDTVEVNSFFYGLPKAETVTGWRETVPEGFEFAVKASRYVTHMKKLKDPEASLGKFWDRVKLLGEQLGPVLFQLPPRWNVNVARLRSFLRFLPSGPRYAFEFRDASWFVPEVFALLEEQQAAFCIYELGEQASPVVTTADFVYVRLHGPKVNYSGSYDDEALRGWARRLREWQGQGFDAYLFFDNDESGYAARDGLRLRQLLGQGEKGGA